MFACRWLLIAGLILSVTPRALAQVTNVTGQTSTPVPGAGHDYVHLLNETVDASSGSVSVHISVPVPPGRKLTLPFGFAYSSSGAWFLQPDPDNGGMDPIANPNIGPMTLGGWSYTLPQLSRITTTHNTGQKGDGSSNCSATTGYVFTDPAGTRHNLELSHVYNYYAGTNESAACSLSGFREYDTGGDAVVRAALLPPFNNDQYANTTPYDGTPEVYDAGGTVYTFPWPLQQCNPTYWTTNYGLASTVGDRNGNLVAISTSSQCANFAATDNLGRQVLSGSNFPSGGTSPQTSTVTVAGLSQPYSLYWTNQTPSGGISITSNRIYPVGDTCATMAGGAASTGLAVTSITLPNGEQYQFTYDSQSGFLTKITYPSGGYVSYSWGANPQSAVITFNDTDGNASCSFVYDTPAVVHRYVSFDGQTIALQQDFSYTTTWNQSNLFYWTSKTTTITTHDLVRGNQFTTVYTWSPSGVGPPPNSEVGFGQIALESTIAYSDTNGSVLKTVQKGWANYSPFELNCELTQIGSGGPVAGTFYTYGAGAQITDKREYNYGQVSVLSACSNTASPPAGITPARETATTYQSGFPTPSGFTGPVIADRPCQVTAKDSGGNSVAETDYYYDSGTALCSGSPTVGNATKIVKRCLQTGSACSAGDSTAIYAYDSHGQTTAMTDARGNETQYSYADNYSGCGGNAPPSSPSGAYLTQVTYPQTNGVNHIVSYCYDYTTGLLRSSTDENNQATSYRYNDSLNRLTETDFPDGGVTQISYYDAPPNPTVTTTKAMNASQSIVSVAVLDGMGQDISTKLTSDPQGTVYTKTVYDGLGRVYQQYNPYRTISDSTYGYTTYGYDALGRTTSVTKPDGSVVSTQYCNNPSSAAVSSSVLVTDEAGHWRRSESDGLGRLVEVDEPNSSSATVNVCPGAGEPIWVTTYSYDGLNDLTSVVQGGSRNRSFSYNSLQEMIQSNNPESGSINYAYDANGNVVTKQDARGITTCFGTWLRSACHATGYDALNRLTQVSFSNGDPSVVYYYDASTCLGQDPCYNVGHRTSMSDAGGTESFAYDKMGRETADQRVTNGLTKSAVYGYDFAGDVTKIIYPTGDRIVDYTYDSADRPSTAQDELSGTYYVKGPCATGGPTNGACYAPQGAISQLENGANVFTTYLYNNRLQPCWIFATVGTPLATNTACSASDLGSAVLDLQYSFNAAHDNGDVAGITNNRDTTRSQSFSYDQVSRIASAQTSATSGTNCWGETYSYDQWANLQSIATPSAYSGCPNEGNWNATASVNNQLPSVLTYDASGNTLSDNFNVYQWNADGELKFAAGVSYTYDGGGNRISKSTGETYWYGLGGEILSETDGQGNLTDEYVFFGGKRVAHIAY